MIIFFVLIIIRCYLNIIRFQQQENENYFYIEIQTKLF